MSKKRSKDGIGAVEVAEYRERAIQMINGYLNGEVTAKRASNWVLKIMVSKEFDQLPPDITEAILCLLDLHDINVPNASWVPDRDAFLRCKTELENNR